MSKIYVQNLITSVYDIASIHKEAS